MSAITNNDIAKAIYLASKDEKLSEHFFSDVVRFLARRRLLSKTKDILSHLDKIINEEEGRVIARISSRDNLNEKTKRELVHSLSKRYSGKTVNLVFSLDEKLLGGFKIEVDDEVIDLTLKNKIGKLQEHLINKI